MDSSRTTSASRVTVLMYHRLGAAANAWEERYCIAPKRFAGHMHALRRRGMAPCSIEQFTAWLDGGAELAAGTFLLTFDDGFLGVYEHAFPLLSALNWPATIFLVSGLIGRTDAWTGRENPSGEAHALLGRREIEEMARSGFSFQSHTRTHADLTSLDRREVEEELLGARKDLEDLLGRPVGYLAYPYGRFDDEVVGIARTSGYDAAFSVQPGFNRRGLDPFRIRRLDVFGTDTATALLRKIKYGSNDGSLWQSVRYFGGRIASRWTSPGADLEP